MHRHDTTPPNRSRIGTASAFALVFFTSAAVLVLEILAGRLVAPYVGVSLETYTGVIGTILAGIALGAWAGGRLADRTDPGRLVGPTLVAGGVLAWLALPVIDRVGPSVGADPFSIVVLTSVGFIAPAAVLSAVSPMVAKLRLGNLGETGTVVGGLAAAGTAGALVGTFATGFVLVAAFPTRTIVLLVGLALVACGVVLWLRMWTGRTAALALIAALALATPAGAWAATTEGPCETQTQYFCARVEVDPQRPSGRTLWLDTERHSYVDLEDPTHLEFAYVQQFALVAEAMTPTGPIDALHIGGAGFTFPRYVGATRPGSSNTVLEIDEELIELAERDLGLTSEPGLVIRTGDARLSIADEPDDRYDLVVGDAFGGLSVPWHLATLEMVREIDRVLRPEGIYVVNVIDGGPLGFARAEVATLAEVFDHVAMVVPTTSLGGTGSPRNIILVASNAPLPSYGVANPTGTILSGDALERVVAGARVLTDDFAPVDQLSTVR